MDPTLAPGYVASSISTAKSHHWAEIQKKRTITATDISDIDGTGDTSSTSLPPTPPAHTVSGRPRTADSGKTIMPRHPRVPSWRVGRSALSDGEGIGGPADLEEVPTGVKRQALRLGDYAFPDHRLRTVMDGIFLLNFPQLTLRRY
jgi:hypothetical protein